MEKDFTDPWDPRIQKISLSFRNLANEAEPTLDLPRHGAARVLPLVVNGVSCWSVLRGRGGDRCSQRHSGRVASGGALAPQPPRATGFGPMSIRMSQFSKKEVLLQKARLFPKRNSLLKTDIVLGLL